MKIWKTFVKVKKNKLDCHIELARDPNIKTNSLALKISKNPNIDKKCLVLWRQGPVCY